MSPNPDSVRSWPTEWTTLTSDNGLAIVVPEGVDTADALVEMLAQRYGGDPFPLTNPAIAEAAKSLRVERWRAYSEQLCEDHGIDTSDYLNWYGPDGDLDEWFFVVYFDGDLYDLGERAEDAQIDGSGGVS